MHPLLLSLFLTALTRPQLSSEALKKSRAAQTVGKLVNKDRTATVWPYVDCAQHMFRGIAAAQLSARVVSSFSVSDAFASSTTLPRRARGQRDVIRRACAAAGQQFDSWTVAKLWAVVEPSCSTRRLSNYAWLHAAACALVLWPTLALRSCSLSLPNVPPPSSRLSLHALLAAPAVNIRIVGRRRSWSVSCSKSILEATPAPRP